MSSFTRRLLTVFFYFVAVLVLPLFGIFLSGQRISPFLVFPPMTRFHETAPFSWLGFWFVTLIIVASLAPLLWRIAVTPPTPSDTKRTRHPFPFFGWIGTMVIGVTWLVAWSRFSWAIPFQRFTFTPLWLGYIAVINALTVARCGVCPLLSKPRLFITLFPLSTLFWWSFEYLNRFVGYWYYPDLQSLSAAQYSLEASLPFSTVLPAIYSTAAWLTTFPRLVSGLDHLTQPQPAMTRKGEVIAFASAALLLTIIPIWPSFLFPLIWIAPLLLLTALQQLLLGDSILHCALRSGNFSGCWIWALAGLFCGVFWEWWNYRSLAHWEYQIPYVARFHVFAMPLLGYAGYLPFGLTCGTLIECVHPAKRRSEWRSNPQ
jgi:hypothetical protein